ncbi:DotU family type IV/VI secretion system protein [Janthinobacterium sp. PC23-8]|uniref:DotU family type IV/VI secretion system protein n=1 Tax=Janthinobacterium sp. PC23-8 TaxID=2012679 RepID=UPI000B9706FE|nr:DotU family type IV/VI secretion system protein [Janthinobacterium sp. PC23-8]OYO27941.1 hypothetical protein CD932_22800 [Janthinobacterium sp. PC23-8]
MKLVDCFIPLLTRIRQFQRQPATDVLVLSAQLDAAIAEARSAAHDAGHLDDDTETALFAVAAWADEAILAADWPGNTEWQRHLLQRRYFDVSNAGVAFYSRLEVLRNNQLGVREVYFLCLGLGFSGRYGYDRNQKALADIRRTSLELLLQGEDGLPGAAGKLLFPDGYGTAPAADVRHTRGQRRWPISALTLKALLIPLAALLALCCVYYIIIWQSVEALLAQIKL